MIPSLSASLGRIAPAVTIVALLLFLVLPMAVRPTAEVSATPMDPCDSGPERCAGLWSSACCDFAAPRTGRLTTPDDPGAPIVPAPSAAIVRRADSRRDATGKSAGPPGHRGRRLANIDGPGAEVLRL